VPLKIGHLDGETAGEFTEGPAVERPLISEQSIVHQPELPLHPSRLRGFSGRLGLRMQLGLRKVPECEAQVVPQLAYEFLYHAEDLPASWRLVVAVLNK